MMSKVEYCHETLEAGAFYQVFHTEIVSGEEAKDKRQIAHK